ncbi:MAG: hypothetical protein OXR72_11320 [Gemmatimonadota bacterium]|nr:hypothetical protein [Gemmatimonadota bacterium]
MTPNRFIIAVHGFDSDEQKQLSDFFSESEGCGWWHWIDGFWLVVDTQGKFNVAAIQEKIREIGAPGRSLVLCVSPNAWSGYGPNTRDKDMFRWIHSNW